MAHFPSTMANTAHDALKMTCHAFPSAFIEIHNLHIDLVRFKQRSKLKTHVPCSGGEIAGLDTQKCALMGATIEGQNIALSDLYQYKIYKFWRSF